MSIIPKAGDIVDGAFRVEEEIDSGNFGHVYRVSMLSTDPLPHDRTLALKVLKTGPHDEEELRRRFAREAALVYRLRHPHVVAVYYSGQTEGGLPYMAMEYLKGTDLRTLLRGHGKLNPKLARRIALEILSALSAAHELDIIHRDLKPANIFLVNDGKKGHVKVLDFGFAKSLEGSRSSDITSAGTLVGTPAYMSPELVHKTHVGPSADIYSVGLILAEMLCGEKIVKIKSIYDTILFQASEEPIDLPKSIIKSPFGPVVQRAISKRLDGRYQSAEEMIADLNAIDLGGRSRVLPSSRTERLTESMPPVEPQDVKPAFSNQPEPATLERDISNLHPGSLPSGRVPAGAAPGATAGPNAAAPPATGGGPVAAQGPPHGDPQGPVAQDAHLGGAPPVGRPPPRRAGDQDAVTLELQAAGRPFGMDDVMEDLRLATHPTRNIHTQTDVSLVMISLGVLAIAALVIAAVYLFGKEMGGF